MNYVNYRLGSWRMRIHPFLTLKRLAKSLIEVMSHYTDSYLVPIYASDTSLYPIKIRFHIHYSIQTLANQSNWIDHKKL